MPRTTEDRPPIMLAPDLDHLRRENAIPATPPKPNAEPFVHKAERANSSLYKKKVEALAKARAAKADPAPRKPPTDMRNAERELVRQTIMGGHPARLEEITASTPSKGKFVLASVPVDLSHKGDEAAMEAARRSPDAISPMAAAGRMQRRVYDTREAARAAVQEFDTKHGTKYEAHLEASGDFEDKHPRVPAGSGEHSGEFRNK